MTIPTLVRTCGALAALAFLTAARPAHAQPALTRPDAPTAQPQTRGGLSGGVLGDRTGQRASAMGGMSGGVLGDKRPQGSTTRGGLSGGVVFRDNKPQSPTTRGGVSGGVLGSKQGAAAPAVQTAATRRP